MKLFRNVLGKLKMQIEHTEFEGLKVVNLKLHLDSRGYFVEKFNVTKFKELGLPTQFAQDNLSRSKPNVIRGLHYQVNPAQGKLVGVISGKIIDVVVDIRKNSKTFGKSYSVELSEENQKLIWIPHGFAHGFVNRSKEDAIVFYKVDNLYSAEGDRAINPLDENLKIDWGLDRPIISTKDKASSAWQDYLKNPAFLK